jgi:uncharacterized phage-like protein YoqJ
MDDLKIHTCCFFGHRKIAYTEELKAKLYNQIEELILNEKVYIFLFGSKSEFDALCLETVSKLKEKYPHIKRIYVRSAFEHITDEYKNYLLMSYDDTYFPEHIKNSGKASYVERNQEMINNSQFCIVYYDANYLPPKRKNGRRDLTDYQPKSGTALAYAYAVKKKCEIFNML